MKKLFVLLAAALSITAFAADAKKDPKAKEPAKADAKPAGFVLGGDAAKGAETFKTLCASCHGEKGDGNGAAAAALNPKPADFTDAKRAAAATDEYIFSMIKNGGAANGKSPMMVAWGPTLGNDDKVRDVAAYVRSLSKAAAPAAPAKDAKPAPKK